MIRTRALAASAPNGRLSAWGIACLLTHPAALPLSTLKVAGKDLVRQVCLATGFGGAAGRGPAAGLAVGVRAGRSLLVMCGLVLPELVLSGGIISAIGTTLAAEVGSGF